MMTGAVTTAGTSSLTITISNIAIILAIILANSIVVTFCSCLLNTRGCVISARALVVFTTWVPTFRERPPSDAVWKRHPSAQEAAVKSEVSYRCFGCGCSNCSRLRLLSCSCNCALSPRFNLTLPDTLERQSSNLQEEGFVRSIRMHLL